MEGDGYDGVLLYVHPPDLGGVDVVRALEGGGGWLGVQAEGEAIHTTDRSTGGGEDVQYFRTHLLSC